MWVGGCGGVHVALFGCTRCRRCIYVSCGWRYRCRDKGTNYCSCNQCHNRFIRVLHIVASNVHTHTHTHTHTLLSLRIKVFKLELKKWWLQPWDIEGRDNVLLITVYTFVDTYHLSATPLSTLLFCFMRFVLTLGVDAL